MSMFMPPSPAGRPIAYVFGDPTTIKERGTEIEELGQMMLDSASQLQAVSDGSDGLKGKAVDKLREGVGDVHGRLKEAGELYKPTGPIVHAYGVALEREQPQIQGHVDTCQSLWETYVALPGSVEPRGTGGWFQPDADSPEAEQQAAEDKAKKDAFDAWEAEAKRFDNDYDHWESAFDTAAGNIDETLAGKIEDSFWDNLDGFVAGLVKVLQVAGMILAVAALIIGGPIVAAIAAVVAVLTLVLTIYQYVRNDAGKLDLALAIVGVIPFGSIGKLAQGKAGVMPFVADVAGGAFKPSTYSAAAQQLRTISMASRFGGGGLSGLRSGAGALWQLNNPEGFGTVMTRLLTGKTPGDFAELSKSFGEGFEAITWIPGAFDFTHGLFGNAIKLANYGTQFAGTEGLSEKFPVLPFLGF